MPVDWSLYESEITRLYVKENRTAEDSLRLLNRKHGTNITLRQFKFKFGGLKNLKADEWRVVCHKIAERKAQGIPSDVYLHGCRQDPERLERAFRLYSSSASERALANIDLGIDTVDQHRIEIRSSPLQNSTRPVEDNSQDFQFAMDMSEDISSDHVDSMETTSENFPVFDIENPTFNLTTPRLHTPSLPLFLGSVYSPGADVISEPALNIPSSISPTKITAWSQHDEVEFESQEVVSDATQTLSSISDFSFNTSLGHFSLFSFPKRSYSLFWDSPALSSIFESLGHDRRTSYEHQVQIRHLNTAKNMVPWKTKGWLSSYLMGIHPKLQLLQPTANLVEEFILRKRFPYYGKIQFNSNPRMLRSFFLIINYLVSNNLLRSEYLRALIEWIISNEHIANLSEFLRLKPPYGNVLIRAVLRETLASGDFPPFHFTITKYPSQFLQLLGIANQTDLAGPLGWNLLKTMVSLGNLEATKLLVERGVSVSKPPHFTVPVRGIVGEGTPLSVATYLRDENILKFLITVGADVNQRFLRYAEERGSNFFKGETTALNLAVSIGNYQAVKILLKAKAKVDLTLRCRGSLNMLGHSEENWPDIHTLLLQHLVIDETTKIPLLLEAARKGIRPLADFLVKSDVMDDESLEQALYHAIEWANIEALVTLLRRGVDANTQKYRRLKNTVSESSADILHPLLRVLEVESQKAPDMIYLLSIFGARLDVGDIQSITSISRLNHLSSQRSVLLIEHHTARHEMWLHLCLMNLVHAGNKIPILSSTALELTPIYHDSPIHGCGALLDAGCAINSYGAGGKNALQTAAEMGNLALVQFLVHRGADVNFPANDDQDKGRTALQAAAEAKHQSVVDYLLQVEADINAPPAKRKGVTALEAAAKACIKYHCSDSRTKVKHMAIFKRLLALGAPVNRTDDDSGGLLHFLILGSNIQLLELTLQKGAATETTFVHFELVFEDQKPVFPAIDTQLTPLQLAAGLRNLEAMHLLLEYGACVNAPAGDNGFTALQATVLDVFFKLELREQEDKLDVVNFLLQYGADVNALPSRENGRTALQGACSHEHPDINMVQLLLHKGADVNAAPAPIRGITALQAASIQGNIQLVRLLLEHGADVNGSPAPEEGRTAVEGTAEHGRSDIVRLLLNKGALPDLETGFSRAIELAKREGHWHIVDLLEDHQRYCGFQPSGASVLDQGI